MQNSSMHFSKPIYTPVRILVVDDHPNTAALLARAISQIGPSVEALAATSGQEALEYLQGGPVDILITDMDMPTMTGLELIERLRQNPHVSPSYTFLLTASFVPGLRGAVHDLNIDAVLSKPIPPQQICKIVRMTLEEMELSRLYKEFVVRKGFRILIAHAEPATVTLLLRYLDRDGYTCSIARDGFEALEQIRKGSPDLILLDADLPYADGSSVLEEIRADVGTRQILVIILGAAGTHERKTHPHPNLSEDDYVTKPIDRRELLLRIQKKLLEREIEKTGSARKV